MTTANDWRVNADDKISPEPNTGCWLWTGSLNNKGYGQIRTGGKCKLVHRLMVGDPPGKIVMHKCDNPMCVNPDHLRAGTPKENTQDMVRKGRAVGFVKLDQELVTMARAMLAEGMRQREVGELFGVTQGTISAAVRGGRAYGVRQSGR